MCIRDRVLELEPPDRLQAPCLEDPRDNICCMPMQVDGSGISVPEEAMELRRDAPLFLEGGNLGGDFSARHGPKVGLNCSTATAANEVCVLSITDRANQYTHVGAPWRTALWLSLIHISEPTRLGMIS